MATNTQKIFLDQIAALGEILASDAYRYSIESDGLDSAAIASSICRQLLTVTQKSIEAALYEGGVDGVEFDLIERMDDVFTACREEDWRRREERDAMRRAAE